MTDRITLAASSMLTPLGNSTARVYRAIEAGINRYRESDILGSDEEPIPMALVPREAIAYALDSSKINGELNARQRRLLRLASVALNQLKSHLPDQPLPLFLAGPEHQRNDSGQTETLLNHCFISNLSQQCDIPIDIGYSRAIHTGRAGALDMVDMAERYFNNTEGNYALVGGVDSYYDVATLDHLDEAHRVLLSTRREGFVPGEGAGFVLLISPKAPGAIKARAMATLSPAIVNHESGHITSEQPLHGNALTDIFAQLTTNEKSPAPTTLYSSVNGEQHYVTELSLSMMRYRDRLSENVHIIRPAEYFGDIGAAFGAVMLGLAAEKLKEKRDAHEPSNRILICCSSDSGMRGGVGVSTVKKVNLARNHEQEINLKQAEPV